MGVIGRPDRRRREAYVEGEAVRASVRAEAKHGGEARHGEVSGRECQKRERGW